MSFNPQFNNAPKNYLFDNQLRYEGIPVEPGAKPPTLLIKIGKNNPKFQVWLNSPSYTKDGGKVELPISTAEMFTFCEFLEDVKNNKDADTVTIKYHEYKWYGKTRSKDKEFIGSITIGRENGVIFIGFNFGDGIDKPKFVFGGRKDVTYYSNTAKKYLEDPEISEKRISSLIGILKHIVTQVLVREYVEPKPRADNGNNQKPQYNNQSPPSTPAPARGQSADYDEDIPWG